MKILGVEIDNLTEKQALERVEDFLQQNKQGYIVTPNSEFLVKAQKDREFKNILNRADLKIPDGIGLVFASKLLSFGNTRNEPLCQRIAGVDFMEGICQRAVSKNWQVLLFGAGPGVAEKTADALKKKYDGLDVSVFKEKNLESLKSCILFVALGAPKQEKWIAQNLAKFPHINLAMGVGGSFDFISGRVFRAPVFIRSLGLEWLWRLILQPWRIRRICNAVFVFPFMVIKNAIRKN